jgi:predicted DNA-binding transcriptional regulator YafY
MGVPIYSETGPMGGYRLMEGYQLKPLQVNPMEAVVILVSLQMMLRYADTPFNQERWSVVEKVKNIINPEVHAGSLVMGGH